MDRKGTNGLFDCFLKFRALYTKAEHISTEEFVEQEAAGREGQGGIMGRLGEVDDTVLVKRGAKLTLMISICVAASVGVRLQSDLYASAGSTLPIANSPPTPPAIRHRCRAASASPSSSTATLTAATAVPRE
ncbi:hypothetical protein GUJ93_ZPchr0010g7952 [Zizania palustris]|uniref:Uncharacterized protein n=1 Tax=Zizania palustris TaxID=103762 RepID=A0A8J5TM89_ZIZPA|nr:hypothetical protein GUJ93_ZPchr0010g7952 [Zizania palustris]